MLGIKIGDKLRIDEVRVGGFKVRGSYRGEVVEEYKYYYSLQSKNYRISLNKSALIDRSVQVKKIKRI